jgi:RecA-family ATPase
VDATVPGANKEAPELAVNSRARIISAAALIGKSISPLVWVVESFIPEGLVILAGKPKMGKSMLALDLGIAVASGNRALGSFRVERGAVLFPGAP